MFEIKCGNKDFHPGSEHTVNIIDQEFSDLYGNNFINASQRFRAYNDMLIQFRDVSYDGQNLVDQLSKFPRKHKFVSDTHRAYCAVLHLQKKRDGTDKGFIDEFVIEFGYAISRE
jgi:hypothetical protein